MSKLIRLLAVLLVALPALAAPVPKMEAGTYRPLQAGTSDLREVHYEPGMVRLTWKSGKMIEVPVLGHIPPQNGHSGVLLLATDPTLVQHPYHPALVYELSFEKGAIWLTHRKLSGNRNTAEAQARSIASGRVAQDSMFLTPAVADVWNAWVEAPPADKDVMLAFLWETVHYGWEDRSQTDRWAAALEWLAHHRYNPIASFKTTQDWVKQHATDPTVQQAVEEAGRNGLPR